MRKRILLMLAALAGAARALAGDTIDVTTLGAAPGSRSDAMPAVRRALSRAKGRPGSVVSFPKGRYDFWPTRRAGGSDSIGFDMRGMAGLTVEGNGSELVFHGWMGVARLDSCAGVTFRGFSVDWDRPLTSQAEIVEAADDHLDVRIDREAYPYVIEDGRVMFLGEGWKLPALDGYNNLFDAKTREIVYNTWDSPLGAIFSAGAEELGGGVVRFHGRVAVRPEAGTVVTLFHTKYAIPGFEVLRSRDVTLRDLRIYHCLSHGVVGYRSENITMDNASLTANEAKGRVFSGIADASHFLNCRGVIRVERCAHTGQGDDFINVHGRNVAITAVTGERTVETRNGDEAPGDEMWVVSGKTSRRGQTLRVEAVEPVVRGGRRCGQRITFTQPLPEGAGAGDFLESKTWTAGLELRDCRVLKRHRARGILVTTPRPVVIERNYFRSAGAAILIEGDTDYWFESGACEDVLIRDNVFEDCLTSGNAHGRRDEWGEAIVTITPSHMPGDERTEPYHRNIRLTGNTFRTFDAPLVRARSVRGLSFTGNRVERTRSFRPYAWQREAFLLDGCRDVRIGGNTVDAAYTTRGVLTEHMRRGDVRADRRGGWDVRSLEGVDTRQTWR